MIFKHLHRLEFLVFIGLIILFSCNSNDEKSYDVTMTVTATAYNSVEAQSKKGNIGIAAWGDRLEPGDKAIAISRDLIRLGLKYNQEVKIEGLDGTFIVKDKMNKRWNKRIDIYMGLDEKAAKEWGKKQVEIKFDTIN
jgi:3D (Asp-Asp-Asp) domain-containing protein